MSICAPLPPSYGNSYSALYSFQPFSSEKRAKRFKKSRTSSDSDMSPTRKSSYVSSKDREFDSASSIRTNSTTTTSDSNPSLKKTKTKNSSSQGSTKSSRSWLKRIFTGSDPDLDEDPDAKDKERSSMWRSMSLGFNNVDMLYTDVGELTGRAMRYCGPWSGPKPTPWVVGF